MYSFTDSLKLTKDGFGDVAAGLGKGFHTIGSAVEQSLKSGDPYSDPNRDSPSHPVCTPHTPDPPPSPLPAPALSSQPQPKSDPPPASVTHSSLLHTLASGAGALLAPIADIAKSGAVLARDATGTKIAHTGLDVGTEVAMDTVSLADTVQGSVVNAAAETSGAVFEPVSSGLKTPHGLDPLGQGVGVVASSETTGAIDSQSQTKPDSPPASAAHFSLLGTLASGTGALLAPTADIAKSGAVLARDATGTKIAHTGLDVGAEVAMDTVSLAGTAPGGVVNAAAETSGAVFEPVSSGLKTPHELDPLGQGVGVVTSSETSGAIDSQLQPKPDSSPASAAHFSLFSTLASGAGALLAPIADIAKSGASLARNATGTSLSIGTKIAHTGLDMGAEVAMGTVTLADTALGGVVNAAAQTSGAVLEPVSSGLKTPHGLDPVLESVSSGLKIPHGLDPLGQGVGTSSERSGAVDSQPPPKPDTSPASAAHFSLLGTLASGAGALLAPTAGIAKSGASLVRHATGAGLSIATKVARSGLDMGANVATGTVSLAGTALGGVVNAAAEKSGAVFEPVSSGLKTLHGLDHLGQGVGVINGLSLDAVRKVKELTTKALNMIGKTPTFFDPDADGIVRVPDTVRGLVLLGLDEKNATYASYALHAVFSYSTSDSWLPAIDKTLPIHVSKMSSTRWGKNWGSFGRLEWVNDIEIDKFIFSQKKKKGIYYYWKLGRQGFGILLLLFEWGTTWPFYMPTVHMGQIPFAHDIGTVVQKAILPTIVSNFKKSREANPQAPEANPQSPNLLPTKVSKGPINMPGEFSG